MEKYDAKSANQFHGTISNKEHLQNVGALARVFGEEIGKSNAAELAGDFHDFGKYSKRFQGVLKGTHQGVDHAFAGAAELYQKLELSGSWEKNKECVTIIEAVAGHHDGLIGLPQIEEELEETYLNNDADCCPSGKNPSLHGKIEFYKAEKAFELDFPGYRLPSFEPRGYNPLRQVENMLETRMLFSCLVDADYSISAKDDDPDYLKNSTRSPIDAIKMLGKLEGYLADLRRGSTANPKVNALRNDVYTQCGAAAEQAMGLYTLTAPTGVGKTMAMLNFALRHCARHQLRRIIVVLPFLTLAEQTEKEYRHIFPEILVDHSQQNLSEEARELAERWDCPVIITTSVRFFESIFSDNPRNCRKLHHIAGSVVLFDEAQCLPASLASPTVKAVNKLCRDYHCTMVFSTATQPNFAALPKTEWKPTEILGNYAELFHKMGRVNARWYRDMSLSQVAEKMSLETNACCIVNLRRHARTLFEALKERVNTRDGVYFLTTDLCPAHRLEVVEKIKQRQREGRTCLVVATQCIEAGVDLDFDGMYRALAPLEAIIQAAGRCNRNGRLTGGGRFAIFRPLEEGRLYPDDSYERAANVVSLLWENCDIPDLNNPELIRMYYQMYFGGEKENQCLENAIRKKDFAEVAKNYRLIHNAGLSLIVPWAGKMELFQNVRCAVQKKQVTPTLLHEATPITITCFDKSAVSSCATQLMLNRKGKMIETGVYILNTGFEKYYDSLTGFLPSGIMHETWAL